MQIRMRGSYELPNGTTIPANTVFVVEGVLAGREGHGSTEYLVPNGIRIPQHAVTEVLAEEPTRDPMGIA